MTEVLGYHHLSLSVTDLGKSTEWYQQVLGLDVAAVERRHDATGPRAPARR